MKKRWTFLMVLALTQHCFCLAALEADLHLHCLSLRLYPATARLLNQDFRNEITSHAREEPSNGELVPALNDSPFSHGGSFRLQMPDLDPPLFFPFLLNTPAARDENTNFLNDFFEVDLPVIATSSGVYNDGVFGDSPLAATWTRPAGQKDGTCRLQLPNLGLSFNHAFELLQLEGKVRYTVQGSNVAGSVTLRQRGREANLFSGPISFTQINTNRLLLVDGRWTNGLGQAFTYFPSDQLSRFGNQYADIFEFLDGDLGTPAPDYDLWLLVVSDSNDADADGVPDLSDAASGSGLSLKLERASGHLLLTIAGESGQACVLERSDSLNLANWSADLTLSLTNALHVIQLPVPTGPTSYWRVRFQ